MVLEVPGLSVDDLSGMSSSDSSSGLGSSESFHLPKGYEGSVDIGIGGPHGHGSGLSGSGGIASGMGGILSGSGTADLGLEEIVSELYPRTHRAVSAPSPTRINRVSSNSTSRTTSRPSKQGPGGVTSSYSNGYNRNDRRTTTRRSGQPSVEQYPEDQLMIQYKFDRSKSASRDLERFKLQHHRSGRDTATRDLTSTLDISRHMAHEKTKKKVYRAAQVVSCLACLLLVVGITLAIVIPMQNNSKKKNQGSNSNSATNGLYNGTGSGNMTEEDMLAQDTANSNSASDNQLWFAGFNATTIRLKSTGSNYTQVQITSRSPTGAILQLGDPITGAHSVALSADGNRFTVLASPMNFAEQLANTKDLLEVWEWQTPPPPSTNLNNNNNEQQFDPNGTTTNSAAYYWSWQPMGYGIGIGSGTSSVVTSSTAITKNGYTIAGHEHVFFWNQSIAAASCSNNPQIDSPLADNTNSTNSTNATDTSEEPETQNCLDASINGWQPLGGSLPLPGSQQWASVAMNADGTRIVTVGAADNIVRVFQWSRTSRNWEPLGDALVLQDEQGATIQPPSTETNERWSDTTMSASGHRIAIGTKLLDEQQDKALVHVYEWTEVTSSEGVWRQVGSTFWAASVALSANGNRIVLGGPEAAVSVYDWNVATDEWVQLGSTLYGRREDDLFGYSVATTSSGNRIVVGSLEQTISMGEAQSFGAGYVRVYDWDWALQDWHQVGGDVNGRPGVEDRFGTRVDIAALMGNRIAVSTARGTLASTRVFAVISRPPMVMGAR